MKKIRTNFKALRRLTHGESLLIPKIKKRLSETLLQNRTRCESAIKLDDFCNKNNPKNLLKKQNGFTLVEMMVSIMIMVIVILFSGSVLLTHLTILSNITSMNRDQVLLNNMMNTIKNEIVFAQSIEMDVSTGTSLQGGTDMYDSVKTLITVENGRLIINGDEWIPEEYYLDDNGEDRYLMMSVTPFRVDGAKNESALRINLSLYHPTSTGAVEKISYQTGYIYSRVNMLHISREGGISFTDEVKDLMDTSTVTDAHGNPMKGDVINPQILCTKLDSYYARVCGLE